MSEKLIVNIEHRYGTLAQFSAAVLPVGVNNQMWWITDERVVGLIHSEGKVLLDQAKAYSYDLNGPSSGGFNVRNGRKYKVDCVAIVEYQEGFSLAAIGGIQQFIGLVPTTAGNFIANTAAGTLICPVTPIPYYYTGEGGSTGIVSPGIDCLRIATNPVGITGQGIQVFLHTFPDPDPVKWHINTSAVFTASADKTLTLAKLLHEDILFLGRLVITELS